MLVLHIIFGVMSLVLHALLLTHISKKRMVLAAAYGSIALTTTSGILLFAEGSNVVHIGVSFVLYAVAHLSLGYARRGMTA